MVLWEGEMIFDMTECMKLPVAAVDKYIEIYDIMMQYINKMDYSDDMTNTIIKIVDEFESFIKDVNLEECTEIPKVLMLENIRTHQELLETLDWQSYNLRRVVVELSLTSLICTDTDDKNECDTICGLYKNHASKLDTAVKILKEGTCLIDLLLMLEK